MNSFELISQQRQKESKLLKIFLASSLMGSLVIHAGAMPLRVGNFWNDLSIAVEEGEIVVEEGEMKVTAIESSPEKPIEEALMAEEPPLEPNIPQEVEFVPDPAPPPIALAPESQAPLPTGVDAPSNTSPLPQTDPVTPMTNSAGDTPVPGASGPITNPRGAGSGFGNATQPTGFAAGGRPDGKPEGSPGGTVGGSRGGTVGGTPGGNLGGNSGNNGSQTAMRTVPPTPQPTRSQQPVCVSCPEPRFQGIEASPRVELRILADGSVEVQLRQSSGNPEVDRATLETMSQWRFDPETVPQEGVRRRVRVTYEEEGSNFQRENENRRRLEAERQAAEQHSREAALRQQPPNTATGTPEPAAVDAPTSTPASRAPTPAAPLPTPAPVEAPTPPPATTPVEVLPPPEAPAPSNVEGLPPPPETAPVGVSPSPEAPAPSNVEGLPPPPEAPSPSNS
jgi:TonB family protein